MGGFIGSTTSHLEAVFPITLRLVFELCDEGLVLHQLSPPYGRRLHLDQQQDRRPFSAPVGASRLRHNFGGMRWS